MVNAHTIDEIISSNRQALEPIPTHTEAVLNSLPEIKAVLFDVYGTLLISQAGDINYDDTDEEVDIIQRALGKAGISTTMSTQDLNALYTQLISEHQDARRREGVEYPEIDIRAVWRDFVKHISGVDATHEDTEQLATWFEVWTNPTDLMPGAAELLQRLSESSLKTGLISNAQFYTRHLLEIYLGKSLEELGISSYLTAFSYEFLEGKPSQLMYSTSASFLQRQDELQPHEILFVGNDCLKDIYPANSVGFMTALFAGDARSLRLREDDPRCKDLKPDLVLTELSQLPDCLPGI